MDTEYSQEDMDDWIKNPITKKLKTLLTVECTSLLQSVVHNINDYNECLKIVGKYQAYLDIIQSMEALQE